MAVVDTVHQRLCELLAEMMSEACGRQVPRPHLSFLALGATEEQAVELTQMVNALFGLDLPADTALRSPTPDALARTIEIAFSGSPAELVDLIDAIADAA
jgi:alkanesulfonate monooxygenase SsuD/methylene tetrahydromethanopterin reductase-like flavin-dependent oxidoreductase (luciferase family)